MAVAVAENIVCDLEASQDDNAMNAGGLHPHLSSQAALVPSTPVGGFPASVAAVAAPCAACGALIEAG
eukprot:2804306-Alexandrium_andersonii.AAC.1